MFLLLAPTRGAMSSNVVVNRFTAAMPDTKRKRVIGVGERRLHHIPRTRLRRDGFLEGKLAVADFTSPNGYKPYAQQK